MRKTNVAVAVATAMGASAAANAADWVLEEVYTCQGANCAAAYLYGQSNFTDDGAGNISQASPGAINLTSYAGITWLTTEAITGWEISSAGNSSASNYSCIEGLFGGVVGSSICGNYAFGPNKKNESTIDGVGGRTIGGDDIIIGPAQSLTGNYSGLAVWADFDASSRDGSAPQPNQNYYDAGNTYLALTTRTIDGAGSGFDTSGNGLSGNGKLLVFSTAGAPVPVPAAVWLFGSALGLLGWARRKAS